MQSTALADVKPVPLPHKGNTYPGQHKAIIDRETWEAVQSQLSTNATARQSGENIKGNRLLTGLIYDETGDPLCPTYSIKKGRRYRYYISKRLVHSPEPHGDGWRIPAKELEHIVQQTICAFLNNKTRLLDALPSIAASPRHIQRLMRGASKLSAEIAADGSIEHRTKLRHLIHRATLSQSTIRIEIPERNLLELMLEHRDTRTDETDHLIHLEASTAVRRRGVETKLIIPSHDHRAPDQRLIKLIARPCEWLEQLSAGSATSVRAIARRDNLNEGDVSRFLPLAFLAPDIVEAIISGRQPTELTAETLRRACPIPYSWADQRNLLGFPG